MEEYFEHWKRMWRSRHKNGFFCWRGRRSKDDHYSLKLRKKKRARGDWIADSSIDWPINLKNQQTGFGGLLKKEKNDKARAALNIAVKERVSKRVCDVVYERAQEEK